MRTIHFLLLAAFAAASANAAPASDENAVSVAADLRGMNLTDEADLRRLDRRVSHLATTVCFPPGNRGVGHVAAFNSCRA
ncbi:MAG TPA: UrcA family protein, partial [Chloroflexota bacterium]|nr:UrcA family protein [Chloroflexota bacterium]